MWKPAFFQQWRENKGSYCVTFPSLFIKKVLNSPQKSSSRNSTVILPWGCKVLLWKHSLQHEDRKKKRSWGQQKAETIGLMGVGEIRSCAKSASSGTWSEEDPAVREPLPSWSQRVMCQAGTPAACLAVVTCSWTVLVASWEPPHYVDCEIRSHPRLAYLIEIIKSRDETLWHFKMAWPVGRKISP